MDDRTRRATGNPSLTESLGIAKSPTAVYMFEEVSLDTKLRILEDFSPTSRLRRCCRIKLGVFSSSHTLRSLATARVC